MQTPKQTGHQKWYPNAKKRFLFGFEPTIRSFRLHDASSQKVVLNCDVHFNEVKPIQEETEEEDRIISESVHQSEKQIVRNDVTSDENEERNEVELSDHEDKNKRSNPRYDNRGKISKPVRYGEIGCSAIVIEPKTYDEAIQSAEAHQWKLAMDENQKVIDNRWVLEAKKKTDGKIEQLPDNSIHIHQEAYARSVESI